MLVNLVGEHCQLFTILSASEHAPAPQATPGARRQHASDTLPTALPLPSHVPMHQLPVSLAVDFLYACSSSADQNRAVHRTSASSAVKSLRWLAKHIMRALQPRLIVLQTGRVFRQTRSNTYPGGLGGCLGAHALHHSNALDNQARVLDAALCIHSSIRFGDAQCVHWHTLQLNTQGLHAVAYATKTTKSRAALRMHLARPHRPITVAVAPLHLVACFPTMQPASPTFCFRTQTCKITPATHRPSKLPTHAPVHTLGRLVRGNLRAGRADPQQLSAAVFSKLVFPPFDRPQALL